MREVPSRPNQKNLPLPAWMEDGKQKRGEGRLRRISATGELLYSLFGIQVWKLTGIVDSGHLVIVIYVAAE